MPWSWRLQSRPVRVVAAVAALGTAYGGGLLTMALVGGHRGGGTPIDEAERSIEARAAAPVPESVLEQAAVDGMLDALGDPHAAYYSPSDFDRFQQVLSGSYTGVGLWVRQVDGQMQVTDVVPASAAATAGLRDGDVVTAVDGEPVTGRSVADVATALRGAAGTSVTVSIRRGSRTLTMTMARARIDEDSVASRRLTPTIEELRVAAFTVGVGDWVQAQVAAAAKRHLDGVVLDLRDDPGGLLDEAVRTASAFITSGPITTYTQRGMAPRVIDAIPGGDATLPVVVLVDGGTASAAEVVAGALQDRDRAVLVGSRTFGKGSVQSPARLSDGSAIELTVGHYLTPLGTSIDGVGISPDVAVPAGSPDSRYDEQAVEVLSGVTADAGSSGRG